MPFLTYLLTTIKIAVIAATVTLAAFINYTTASPVVNAPYAPANLIISSQPRMTNSLAIRETLGFLPFATNITVVRHVKTCVEVRTTVGSNSHLIGVCPRPYKR